MEAIRWFSEIGLRLDLCAVDAAQVAVAEALTADAYDTAAVQTEVVAARGAVALAEGDAATALPLLRNPASRRGAA